jgi:hypothetical protein
MISIPLGKYPTVTIGVAVIGLALIIFLIIKIFTRKNDQTHVKHLEGLVKERWHYMEKRHIRYLFKLMQEQYPQYNFTINEFNEAYKNVNKEINRAKRIAHNNSKYNIGPGSFG